MEEKEKAGRRGAACLQVFNERSLQFLRSVFRNSADARQPNAEPLWGSGSTSACKILRDILTLIRLIGLSFSWFTAGRHFYFRLCQPRERTDVGVNHLCCQRSECTALCPFLHSCLLLLTQTPQDCSARPLGRRHCLPVSHTVQPYRFESEQQGQALQQFTGFRVQQAASE